jgi:hypothetical protein
MTPFFDFPRPARPVMIAGVAIAQVVRDHGIRSISDIPRADFNGMPDVLARLGEVRYLGHDIVSRVVSRNRELHPNYEFYALDITAESERRRRSPPTPTI